MLTYHPALDPFHAAFRAVRLLSYRPDVALHRDELRLFDFYLLFPSTLADMMLPRDLASHRSAFRARTNRYWFSGEPLLVFNKIAAIQQQGLALLRGAAYVEAAENAQDYFRITLTALRSPLLPSAQQANARDENVVAFLLTGLHSLSPFGPKGLKARSGLMEYRYDPA